jgi:hypothetical protein
MSKNAHNRIIPTKKTMNKLVYVIDILKVMVKIKRPE